MKVTKQGIISLEDRGKSLLSIASWPKNQAVGGHANGIHTNTAFQHNVTSGLRAKLKGSSKEIN